MTFGSETESASPAISSSLIETVAWCAMLAALPFVAIDVVCGNWDHDGGFYLLRGWYISSGLRPYLDFGTIYPPLGDIITAAFLKAGFAHLVLAIALPILWVLATMMATALLVYRATRDRALAVLVAALVPAFSVNNGGNHLTLEHCVSVFSLLAFLPLVSESRLTSSAAARAIFFSVAAILSKQTGLVTLVVVTAGLIDRRHELTRRHILAMAAAALALPIAILAWLGFDLVRIHANVVSRLTHYTSASDSTNWGVIPHEFVRAPATAWLFVATIVIGVILAARVRGIRLMALAAAAGVVVQFLPRLIRDYSHYNLNAWPLIALVLALALARTQRFVALATRAALLLLAVIVNASLLFTYPWAGVSPLLHTYYPAATIVASITPENATVRQYGTEPIIEFLAWRREEMIERPWDPAWLYPTPPHPNSTIVIVHNRERNNAKLLAWLEHQGFVPVAQIRAHGLITILRHRRSFS